MRNFFIRTMDRITPEPIKMLWLQYKLMSAMVDLHNEQVDARRKERGEA